jgi:hypothetical protein
MMKRSEPIDWPVYLLAVAIVLGLSFGAACLGAWAVQSIWPSVPFWPAAILVWLCMGLFSRSSKSAS